MAFFCLFVFSLRFSLFPVAVLFLWEDFILLLYFFSLFFFRLFGVVRLPEVLITDTDHGSCQFECILGSPSSNGRGRHNEQESPWHVRPSRPGPPYSYSYQPISSKLSRPFLSALSSVTLPFSSTAQSPLPILLISSKLSHPLCSKLSRPFLSAPSSVSLPYQL